MRRRPFFPNLVKGVPVAAGVTDLVGAGAIAEQGSHVMNMLAQRLPEAVELDQQRTHSPEPVLSGRADHELRGVLILTSTLCQIERAIDHAGAGRLGATRQALAMALKLTATFRAEVESAGSEAQCPRLDELTMTALTALEEAHECVDPGAIREAREVISSMGGCWIERFASKADEEAA